MNLLLSSSAKQSKCKLTVNCWFKLRLPPNFTCFLASVKLFTCLGHLCIREKQINNHLCASFVDALPVAQCPGPISLSAP
ncbi:hypothetical protein PanWU01x14_306970 [Parasponia andersonii]|uniref:Uncharacterized protein n=1 Tax=Parasponia andersonii TaxID=3476 RepID=A0A2P5ARK7_PARAD|nr:hypothetical protein PanWU01x14_306970 [Parasponia andersonii]